MVSSFTSENCRLKPSRCEIRCTLGAKTTAFAPPYDPSSNRTRSFTSVCLSPSLAEAAD